MQGVLNVYEREPDGTFNLQSRGEGPASERPSYYETRMSPLERWFEDGVQTLQSIPWPGSTGLRSAPAGVYYASA